MKEIIKVNKEVRKFLMATFGITERRVRMALNDEKRGGITPEVRKLALEQGGRIQQVLDGVETSYDANRVMRQVFPNGVLLVVDTRSGASTAMLRGDKIGEWNLSRISDLMRVQRELAAL